MRRRIPETHVDINIAGVSTRKTSHEGQRGRAHAPAHHRSYGRRRDNSTPYDGGKCAMLERTAEPYGITDTENIEWIDVDLPHTSRVDDPVFVVIVGDCLSDTSRIRNSSDRSNARSGWFNFRHTKYLSKCLSVVQAWSSLGILSPLSSSFFPLKQKGHQWLCARTLVFSTPSSSPSSLRISSSLSQLNLVS